MNELTPATTTDLDIYGAGEMPWTRAAEALGHGSLPAETSCFLTTVCPDGRPHTTAVGAAVHGDALWFTSGPGVRKSRNLATDPRCTLAMRLDGIDLVVEGRAERVTDPAVVEEVVALYRDGGWPARAEGADITAEYSAQSAGPPPWHLYRVTVTSAHGVGLREPFGASRWTFEQPA